MKKKQALVESAIRLFAHQGFEGTSTLQIAKEAGVTYDDIISFMYI